jgi:benzoyl-CoA reductase/2-hydroxyglutaryl-CoA dehydratase subunit BcrC/BadD/HgdB
MGTVDSIIQYVQDHLRDGPVAIKEASEAGRIIPGMYCTYTPWELIHAAGAIGVGFLVDETKDPMEALTEKYLATGCSVMSPNRHRMESLDFLMEHYRVDGVVEVLLTACHTYAVEAHTVRERAHSRGKKYLMVETDYSESDREQLATRMDAFIEML